jgi:hypothetical protein
VNAGGSGKDVRMRTMIRYVKPSRTRDVIGIVMLVLTAFLLWARAGDRVTGAGADGWVDVVTLVDVPAPAPLASID